MQKIKKGDNLSQRQEVYRDNDDDGNCHDGD